LANVELQIRREILMDKILRKTDENALRLY
jgi:hypothetical protein